MPSHGGDDSCRDGSHNYFLNIEAGKSPQRLKKQILLFSLKKKTTTRVKMNNYKDQIRNETRCREISLQQIKVTEG